MTLNADLHCHSTVSDGTLSPEELAARAKANGVALWALTDHDEVGGQHRRSARPRVRCGLDYLTGVEISVSFAGETVHIVGLGIDPDDPALRDGLAAHARRPQPARARDRRRRWPRSASTAPTTAPQALAGNPDLISRTHFARWLVEHRRVPRHARGVPPLPHRRQARLRAAPLGLAARRRGAGSRRRRHGGDRAPGALQVQRQRGVRAVQRVQGARRARRRGA